MHHVKLTFISRQDLKQYQEFTWKDGEKELCVN